MTFGENSPNKKYTIVGIVALARQHDERTPIRQSRRIMFLIWNTPSNEVLRRSLIEHPFIRLYMLIIKYPIKEVSLMYT